MFVLWFHIFEMTLPLSGRKHRKSIKFGVVLTGKTASG